MLSQKTEYDEQQDEEDFRCPKCKWFFSTLTKPYILPCNHNICLKCIDSLIIENKTICPICNSIFNKEERNSFQVNIVFLNILLKILQSKIILCKKCNKIFYWKEHYNNCDQSNFIETTKLFNEIKIACEEGIKIIKLYNNNPNILFKYKSNIFENIKRTLREISDLYKKEINIGFKKLFFTSKKIDFNQSKKDIISFLELCLPYNNYFDENEIINILEKYNYNSPQKKPYFKTGYGLSPIQSQLISHSPFNIKNLKNFTDNKNSTVMISQMSKGNQKIINYTRNINEINNYEINNNKVKKNNYNNQRVDQNHNMFNKMINDNNKKNNIGYINVNNINNNNNKRNSYGPNQPQNTVFYCSNTKPKNRKSKFNIYDILNENEPNEEKDKKRIIVGLKDIKVISNNNILKKEYKEDKNRNLIHIKNKSIDNKNNNSIFINYNKNLNISSLNKNINLNFMDDESEASTIRIENPSLNLLRSNEFTKRIYPLNAEDKRKKLLRYQKACQSIEKDRIKNKNSKYNNSSSCLIIKNNDKDNKINKKISLSSMNKLFGYFNKIKDIINEINDFNNFLTFTSDYINKDVEFRISILRKLILNDYDLLLNEISYNFNQSPRRWIISFLDNSKKICLYDANLNKFKTKDFENILNEYQNFDKSMSIDFDDNDLIFISGGIEKSQYNCSNNFLILKWSTENIEYNGTLPERKSYHSTLYYDNKLYLIGGIDSNKKVSKECQVFSLIDKKWHNLPCLNVGRANSSICIYNNNILYAFRGRDDNDVLDSIECIKLFNLRSSWKIFKPIDYGYVWNPAENSLIITIDKGKILICGGEDKDGNLFNDTFLFETNTKKIYKGIDLSFPASFKSHACFNKGKYFCFDIQKENDNHRDNLEFGGLHIYDPKENIWSLN